MERVKNVSKRPAAIGAFAVAALVGVAAYFGLAAAGTAHSAEALLPNGWFLRASQGRVQSTDTMPQGAALSADGTTLAVVESGFNPATLRLYATSNLHEIRRISLAGAFGRPVWHAGRILVAGANADALFDIDPHTGVAHKIVLPAKSYPVAVAVHDGLVAVATDGDGSLRVGRLERLGMAPPMRVGSRPGGIAFSSDGSKVFVAIRSASYVASVAVGNGAVHRIATGLHPSDVLVRGGELDVAESDADAVGMFEVTGGRRLADVFVGTGTRHLIGASPNALAAQGDRLFVSLGAANQIAIVRARHVVARIATGWYPTDVAPAADRVYIVDGKGEGTKPNPQFDFRGKSLHGYVAAIQTGSLRTARLQDGRPALDNVQIAQPAPSRTVLRQGGPIAHVFFILKENRSYDQILGDMPAGNGLHALTWFGQSVTPNQHALARRFGLFDNAYASGEVSDAGHNWADAAFANDYTERFWPLTYGGRRDVDDIGSGSGPAVPAGGYIWDAARAARVSFRDYGEMEAPPPGTTAPSLRGRFDPRYVSWNLDYSDLDRVKEWRREFDAFLRGGNVPQFEYIWLPNDHTYGSRPGKLTPAAYVATNDYAVGLIVQALSHSRIWHSSAVFIIEDDAQDGADHVSDQRTTLYVASPYARGGLQHAHYSTLSVLHSMELILGLKPLGVYDATAVPMYAAFGSFAHLQPFNAVTPQIDVTTRNLKVAFGAASSVRADFSRPDAAPPGLLRAILARNHQAAPKPGSAGKSVAFAQPR